MYVSTGVVWYIPPSSPVMSTVVYVVVYRTHPRRTMVMLFGEREEEECDLHRRRLTGNVFEGGGKMRRSVISLCF